MINRPARTRKEDTGNEEKEKEKDKAWEEG
jgi:hypothetical protein